LHREVSPSMFGKQLTRYSVAVKQRATTIKVTTGQVQKNSSS
jgi:hypothetical protein